MLIRVTEHTRRKPGRRCNTCRELIEPGQVYRFLLVFGLEIAGYPAGTWANHSACVAGREDFWTETERERHNQWRNAAEHQRAVEWCDPSHPQPPEIPF